MLRIGCGYDIHRTAAQGTLMLGGVRIPADFGLEGYSDADVLLHAVTDAVLGAFGLGDIGQWFPDNDPEYRGMASGEMLSRALAADALCGWRLLNLDSIVIAETPKLAPHIPGIRQSLASFFRSEPGRVSVKATTNEGIGAIGRCKAIAAYAVLIMAHEKRIALFGSMDDFEASG